MAEWASETQDLRFADETDVFAAAEFTTGELPQDSPLRIEFFIASEGGAFTEMDATSDLTWPDALTHAIVGVPGSGWFALVTDLTMQADIIVDVWGYSDRFAVWSESLYMHDEAEFEPLLLPDGTPVGVDLESDGNGIDPFEYNVSVFTGVDLAFQLDAFPRSSAGLLGKRIETGEAVMANEGETALLPIPEEDPGQVALESVYVAQLDATLAVILRPSMEICSFVGCIPVAEFDIPIDIVGVDEERAFTPVAYVHPLPSIAPPITSHDFGEIEVGNLANLELPLSNVGRMDLEGFARIEGDPEFTVFPEYFYASPDQTDGLVVTYTPSDAAQHSAILVIESSDPARPEVRIPLLGNAYNEDIVPDIDDEPEHARVSTCGCDAGAVSGLTLAWLAPLFGLIARRRRS